MGALSYPPVVIDDSSWKSVAESFTVALTLTLRGYESAIAPFFEGISNQRPIKVTPPNGVTLIALRVTLITLGVTLIGQSKLPQVWIKLI